MIKALRFYKLLFTIKTVYRQSHELKQAESSKPTVWELQNSQEKGWGYTNTSDIQRANAALSFRSGGTAGRRAPILQPICIESSCSPSDYILRTTLWSLEEIIRPLAHAVSSSLPLTCDDSPAPGALLLRPGPDDAWSTPSWDAYGRVLRLIGL